MSRFYFVLILLVGCQPNQPDLAESQQPLSAAPIVLVSLDFTALGLELPSALNPNTRADYIAHAQRLKTTFLDHASLPEHALIDRLAYLPLLTLRADSATQARLAALPGVIAVFPNAQLQLQTAQAFPAIGLPLENGINADPNAGAGTIVAVIDQAVDLDLPGLIDNRPRHFARCAEALDVNPALECPRDADSPDAIAQIAPLHGTNVVGIVAAVAPAAGIWAINVAAKVIRRGEPALFLNQAAVGRALAAIAEQPGGVVAISMSFVFDQAEGICADDTSPLLPALSMLHTLHGITLVGATGNDERRNALRSPSCGANVIAVSAFHDVDAPRYIGLGCQDIPVEEGDVPCFANTHALVDILAPGVRVTALGSTLSGTSQAAPIVAGAVAIMQHRALNDPASLGLDRPRRLTPDEVRSALRQRATLSSDGRRNLARLDLAGEHRVPQITRTFVADAEPVPPGERHQWTVTVDQHASITGIRLDLLLDHPQIEQLTLTLTAPDGTSVTPQIFGNGMNAIIGVHQEADLRHAFDGKSAQGEWTLILETPAMSAEATVHHAELWLDTENPEQIQIDPLNQLDLEGCVMLTAHGLPPGTEATWIITDPIDGHQGWLDTVANAAGDLQTPFGLGCADPTSQAVAIAWRERADPHHVGLINHPTTLDLYWWDRGKRITGARAITLSVPAECVPNCANRVCGDDSCGGFCGACGAVQICSSDGLCQPLPNPGRVVDEPIVGEEIWTLAESPIQVDINLEITGRLTIEPGVIVHFTDPSYGIHIIEGELIAQGTAANPITLGIDRWMGLLADGQITLEHVHFRSSDTPLTISTFREPDLAHLRLTGNERQGIVLRGVSGALTNAGAPYLVDNLIVVPQNQTLQIGAGAELRFARRAGLTIAGRLQVDGVPNSPVRFVAMDEFWAGLHFPRGLIQPASHLRSAIIREAQQPISLGRDVDLVDLALTANTLNTIQLVSSDVLSLHDIHGIPYTLPRDSQFDSLTLHAGVVIRASGELILPGPFTTLGTQNRPVLLTAHDNFWGGLRLTGDVPINSEHLTIQQAAHAIELEGTRPHQFNHLRLFQNQLNVIELAARNYSNLVRLTTTSVAYGLMGDTGIDVDGTLELAAGVVLKALPGASLQIDGQINANGLPHAPVVLTAITDDTVLSTGRRRSVGQPNDWTGIRLAGRGLLSHTHVRFAGADPIRLAPEDTTVLSDITLTQNGRDMLTLEPGNTDELYLANHNIPYWLAGERVTRTLSIEPGTQITLLGEDAGFTVEETLTLDAPPEAPIIFIGANQAVADWGTLQVEGIGPHLIRNVRMHHGAACMLDLQAGSTRIERSQFGASPIAICVGADAIVDLGGGPRDSVGLNRFTPPGFAIRNDSMNPVFALRNEWSAPLNRVDEILLDDDEQPGSGPVIYTEPPPEVQIIGGLEGSPTTLEAMVDAGVEIRWQFQDGTLLVGNPVDYTFADDGSHPVRIGLIEPGFRQSFLLMIPIANVDPIITSVMPDNIDIFIPFTHTPTATDPGADPLTFGLVNGPNTMTFEEGTLHWTPTPAQRQNLEQVEVHIMVEDGDGGRDEQVSLIRLGFVDNDQDGVPDQCEIEFGELDVGDTDGDGDTDRNECLAGRDPTQFDGPSAPELSSPSPDARLDTLEPLFELINATDPNGDPLVYIIQILDLDETPLFTSEPIEDADPITWQPQPLEDNQRYLWRAQAMDPYTSGPWSPTQGILIDLDNEPPETPTPISPDGMVDQTPTLTASVVSDPEDDPITYQFEILADGQLIESGDSDTPSWTPDPLPGGRYQWQVSARDSLGATSEVSFQLDFTIAEDDIGVPEEDMGIPKDMAIPDEGIAEPEDMNAPEEDEDMASPHNDGGLVFEPGEGCACDTSTPLNDTLPGWWVILFGLFRRRRPH